MVSSLHHQDRLPLQSTVIVHCRHHDPPSAATSVVVHHHYQMPTRYRIHHYYHDLWYTIHHHYPRCGHSRGPWSADDKAKGLRGRSQVSNMYWWDMNFFWPIIITVCFKDYAWYKTQRIWLNIQSKPQEHCRLQQMVLAVVFSKILW